MRSDNLSFLAMRAFAGIVLSFAGLLAGTGGTVAQGLTPFQPVGCYYHKPDNNRLWLATIALNPKYIDPQTYEDESFRVIVQSGADLRREIPGSDVLVHPLAAFNYKGAEKYQFMKYSLIVDYSSSIPDATRQKVISILDDFIGKMPLPVEGQLIRFATDVEKFPFTRDPNEIKRQLNAPINYGATALNDALMEGALSLVKEGANIPVKVMIVFTDGFDNSSKSYGDKQNFLSTFQALVTQERIGVLAVGVSADQDRDLLRAITNSNLGILGHYVDVQNWDQMPAAFDRIKALVNSTVIFRVPKFGPDKGNATISLVNKSKSGSLTTIQQFDCKY